jgi:hypothetical protein
LVRAGGVKRRRHFGDTENQAARRAFAALASTFFLGDLQREAPLALRFLLAVTIVAPSCWH